MKIRAYPIISVNHKTVVSHRAMPWRAWVSIYRSGHHVETHVFDPPYQKVVTGRFNLTPPISKRYRGVLG
jgi:hypothetical protein